MYFNSKNSVITTKNKLKKLQEDYKANIDFESEKNKLKSIKGQYFYNLIYSRGIIDNIKYNINKIDRYQNNIIDLNNKCKKYSDLIQSDNLLKYKEENKKNLKIYKSKQTFKTPKKNKITTSRSLSYNKNYKNYIKDKNNNKMKKAKSNKNNYISDENLKRKEIKEKREKDINNKLLFIFRNDYMNNNIGNCLNYYNNLLSENVNKKRLFYKELEFKSKQIENNKNKEIKSNSYSYKYGININKGYYNNQNIDKNLHIKYIYNPQSNINQSLYYLKQID